LHDRHALIIQLAKQLHDLFALTGVQISGGFVGQEQLRVSNDCPRNTDQLLLPPRSWRGYKSFLPTIWKRSSVSATRAVRSLCVMAIRQWNIGFS